MKIQTWGDANAWFVNSRFFEMIDYKLYEKVVDYIYRHADYMSEENQDNVIKSFLESEGLDPSDYNL